MKTRSKLDRRLSIAPMMDLTDRHARYFFRLITKRTLLYTEMITSTAILHGDLERLIGYHPAEHPIALQLGGSDPEDLAACARIAEQWGYDEVNLNCGCPSDRVQKGAFGACLMKQPSLVAESVDAMKNACDIDVTVKCRIGVDDLDAYDHLVEFAQQVNDASVDALIVHARKAWLSGLSPKENREIPPLDYPRVYRLKEQFPNLEIVLNGGITSLAQGLEEMGKLDGIMIGRAAYYTPWILAQADELFFAESASAISREEVIMEYGDYVRERLADGAPLTALSRHILGLYHGMAGARRYRRTISENAHRPDAGFEVIMEAIAPYLARSSANAESFTQTH